jgi:hypothetical protein
VAQRENAAFPLELNQSAQSLSAARSNEVARFGRDPSFAQTPHARAPGSPSCLADVPE